MYVSNEDVKLHHLVGRSHYQNQGLCVAYLRVTTLQYKFFSIQNRFVNFVISNYCLVKLTIFVGNNNM